MTRKTFKIALAALAVMGTVSLASPSLADGRYDRGNYSGGYSGGSSGGYGHGDWDGRRDNNIYNRIAELRDRINSGVRRGNLTRYEARRLYGELDRITYDARRADRSGRGVNRWEYDRLDARLDRLAAQVYFERRDNDYAYRRH